MSYNNRRRMPSEDAIREYWADALWKVKGFDSREEFLEHNICFACCFYDGEKTERAHILARINGGSDDVINLHMLCHTCHKDSECLDGDAYMDWFYQRKVMDRIVSEAVRMGFNCWSELNKAPGES